MQLILSERSRVSCIYSCTCMGSYDHLYDASLDEFEKALLNGQNEIETLDGRRKRCHLPATSPTVTYTCWDGIRQPNFLSIFLQTTFGRFTEPASESKSIQRKPTSDSLETLGIDHERMQDAMVTIWEEKVPEKAIFAHERKGNITRAAKTILCCSASSERSKNVFFLICSLW